MKRYKIQLIAVSILIGLVFNGYSQSYEIRTQENDMGYIEVQMRETDGGEALPETDDLISDIAFAVKWPSALATDIEFLCPSSQSYNMRDPSGTRHIDETNWHYRYYTAQSTPFYVPEDWTVNVWVTITVFKSTSGTGTNGAFSIAEQGFGISTLNWSIKEFGGSSYIQYAATINGSISNYTFPTTIYDFVWVGGGTGPGTDPNRWNQTNNWKNECGDNPASGYWPYQNTENVYIPDVSGGSNDYPENFVTGAQGNYAYKCKNIIIAENAMVTVPDLSLNTWTYFDIQGDLEVNGTLNLSPKGHTTVSGNTTINSAEGVVVQATVDGVGSFIDDGISYGASGSAKVQTYLTNSAGAGNLDTHLIGATVDEENYTGSGTGCFLEAFNLINTSTYAYVWDESVVSANGWVNIVPLTYEVNTAVGLGLSTTDNSPHTLEMTGKLISGTVTNSLTYSNNHYELISNPYPSAIDFNALAGANSGIVNNSYRIYDPAANSWVAKNSPYTGTDQYIQAGQGFFVNTTAAGDFTFTNTQRAHSLAPFRDDITDMLSVKIVGGQEGYKDELSIRFDEYATSGFDAEMECDKWYSANSDATMIESVADGDIKLAINVLPLESLNLGTAKVPVRFKCGYDTEYTLSFNGIDTFEEGTPIWLEDKQVGGDWILIKDNSNYTFTATPEDLPDRFVIHFFSPTTVVENGATTNNTIDIYSFRENVFVRNNTNEIIKSIKIYNLSGILIHDVQSADQRLNEIWVSDKMGYYVVIVATDQNVHNKKIFISK